MAHTNTSDNQLWLIAPENSTTYQNLDSTHTSNLQHTTIAAIFKLTVQLHHMLNKAFYTCRNAYQ